MRALGLLISTALTFSTLLAGCAAAPSSPVDSGAGPSGAIDPNKVGVGGSLVGLDPTIDTDQDGTPDVIEGTGDANGNNIPAHLDPAETPSPGPISNPTPTQDGGPGMDGDARVDDRDGCGVVSAESQFERAPVDVIWTIDNSGSMDPYFAELSAGLGNFTSSVASSGANMHVVMLSAFIVLLDPTVAADTATYRLLPANVDSTSAFEVTLNQFGGYSDFLRPDAATHVIVVTDDGSDMSKDAFRTQMETNLGHEFYFHAIATQGFLNNFRPFPTAYGDLAAETGGQSQPITGDWNVILDELQSAIVETAPLPCEVAVPDAKGADLENVQVLYTPTGGSEGPFPKAENAEQCGEALAWHYDDNDEPTQIILCPAACDDVKEGGNLDVVIACEPPPTLF